MRVLTVIGKNVNLRNAYLKATFGMAGCGAPTYRTVPPLVLMVFAFGALYLTNPLRRQAKSARNSAHGRG